MSKTSVHKVALRDMPPNRARGGDLRILLSPVTVGATSGFMGAGTLAPGERITDHYHPYSEEFLYVVHGSLTLTIDGMRTLEIGRGEGVMVPINVRHGLENRGAEPAFAVFHTAPLAPRPDLGHVDVEPPVSAGPVPAVGGPSGAA